MQVIKNRKGTTILHDYEKKIITVCICLFLVSCASRQPVKIPPDGRNGLESSETGTMEEDDTLSSPEPEKPLQSPDPRDLASQKLMEQAVVSLEDNNPDESISTLERAVHISPGRGENYYYLAEAWYMKGNYAQARENNSRAAICLREDAKWMNLIEEQKRRIDSAMQ
jgi:tetratricopeptide (TPR) repeat protein